MQRKKVTSVAQGDWCKFQEFVIQGVELQSCQASIIISPRNILDELSGNLKYLLLFFDRVKLIALV